MHLTAVGKLKQFGLDLAFASYKNSDLNQIKQDLREGRPIITLVQYQYLPEKFSSTYKEAHWVLLVGYEGDQLIYHDPYYPPERQGEGAYKRIRQPDFDNVWWRTKETGNTARMVMRLRAPSIPLAPPPKTQTSYLSWTRPLTGFKGTRWEVWEKLLKGKLQGMDWDKFVSEVLAKNPSLATDGNVFQPEKRYRLPENVMSASKVSWTRELNGFKGTRWECWEKFLKGKIEGLEWNAFVEQALAENPELAKDGNLFQAEKRYRLPENVVVRWSRPLSGFKGTRWECWEAHVKGKVKGMPWDDFVSEVLLANPALADDAFLFDPAKSYRLPENIDEGDISFDLPIEEEDPPVPVEEGGDTWGGADVPRITRLPVPWLSQVGDAASYAPADAGTACVAMLLHALMGRRVTVDEVSEATGLPPGFERVTFSQLRIAAAQFGMEMRWTQGLGSDGLANQLDERRPVLVYVPYQLLPERHDPALRGGHYLLLVGDTGDRWLFHDPYWPSEAEGAYREIDKATFAALWAATEQELADTPCQALVLRDASVPAEPPVPPARLVRRIRSRIRAALADLEEGETESAHGRLARLVHPIEGNLILLEQALQGGLASLARRVVEQAIAEIEMGEAERARERLAQLNAPRQGALYGLRQLAQDR